jgi:hypothetical protein
MDGAIPSGGLCKSLCRKDLGLAGRGGEAATPLVVTTYVNSKKFPLFL